MIRKIAILIYIVLILVLGTATILEAIYGTAYVEKAIYHAGYFCALWGGLAAVSVAAMVKYRLWKRFSVFLLHLSFLTILSGAWITYVYGQKGYVHLRSGVETNLFQLRESRQKAALPFALRLDRFRIDYYPGTKAPKDYISYVTCIDKQSRSEKQVKISMNKIWNAGGYRFYQTSFDEDSKGSFLSVNYDPWGSGITYAGYILLAFSMVAVLCARKGRFRCLLRSRLHASVKVILPLLLTFIGTSGFAAGAEGDLPVLNRRQADSLSSVQVIYNDRVTPFNTLAKHFVLKLYGKSRYKGLTPEQVVGGWVLSPDRWRHEPIIYIKSGLVSHLLHLKSSYASLADFFDGDRYRLQSYYGKGNPKLDQAIWEADEKIGLISMLLQGTLIHPIAKEKSVIPLSEKRVEAELIYNKVPFCKLLFILNLTLGLSGLAYLFYRYWRKGGKGRLDDAVNHSLNALLYAVTLVHSFSYSLHWYIAGHIPLGNGYETMLFMALVILIFSCIVHRKYPFITPFGFLLSGFTLLVAYLGQSNPQITPLMPVLLSPWLSSHVSLIMISYALFAFIFLNGILALSLTRTSRRQTDSMNGDRIRQLTLLSELLLYPAVACLGIGIFLGAVWANESWGRYWAWDPKEVWALITFMVYGAALHMKPVGVFKKTLFYHWYLVLSFLSVLMTYFGVNYMLGGMHSYA